MLQALKLLDGDWRLLYTDNGPVCTFISAVDLLPVIELGSICQRIDRKSLRAESRLNLTSPVRVDLAASTPFAPAQPRAADGEAVASISSSVDTEESRVELVHSGTEVQVATPEVFETLSIPLSIRIGSLDVDLSGMQAAFAVMQTGMRSMQRIIEGDETDSESEGLPRTALRGRAVGSLLTTFVDADTRLARADDGSLFVFVKNAVVPPRGE